MMMISRRDALAFGAGLSALGLAGAPALAQQRFFRIGTGGTGGTYYPVGGMIANAISTPTVNVSAVATNGSVANVNGIVGGSMESGFSQADINAWAYTGTGIYEGKPKIEELRVIANLYPESVHVVVKKGADIKIARGPEGQARLDRRARLGHAGQCARAARRVRRERARHPARIPEAGAVGREVQGRLARRVFPDHRLSAGHAVRTCRHQRLRASRDRGRAARQDHGAVQVLREGQDPGRHLQGRERVSRPSRSARSGRRRRSSPTISSTRSPRRCGATRPAPRWTPAMPRARTSRRKPRCRASAFRCMRAPRSSTRRSG